MTTITDAGLEWLRNSVIGEAPGEIHRIAVGTGTGSEHPESDGLDNEVYSATGESPNAEIIPLDEPGHFEAIIQVKGGTEVDAGTEITEFGVFVVLPEEVLLFAVDNFEEVPVEAGHTEQFSMEVEITR